MNRALLVAAILTGIPALCSTAQGLDVGALVKKSVANTERNWAEAPNFAFTEHDVVEKLDAHGRIKSKVDKTYEVVIIDGSDYNRLLKVNGKPLSPEEEKAEEKKMEEERQRRMAESPTERAKRVAKYQKERRQDELMIKEMTDAFDWKLAGEQTVRGRVCYMLQATPKAGYVPKTRETKVLTGMRGTLWIDKAETQWVKVEAVVVQPVSFYAIATVSPGTRFSLEQEPVGDGLWMPKHFAVRVNSNVLWMAHNSNDDETYANYHRIAGEAARSTRDSSE